MGGWGGGKIGGGQSLWSQVDKLEKGSLKGATYN